MRINILTWPGAGLEAVHTAFHVILLITIQAEEDSNLLDR